MPRQDSTYDQMLDVLAGTRKAGNALAADWLQCRFFAFPRSGDGRLDERLRDELHATSRLAVKLGCYDADDWLRRALDDSPR